MRAALLGVFLALVSSLAITQATPPPPQTARQALIEMFFGTAPNHLEKHLPDTTRNTLKKLGSANGMSALDEFSMIPRRPRLAAARWRRLKPDRLC